MSSQKQNERFDKDYWVHFADTTAEYMTAKRITVYILTIAICVQIIGMMIQPSEWLIWNALTFIIATNLGAVVLAIKAQHSADEIRVLYKTAFDADFYHTLALLSNVKTSVEREAEKEGITLSQEADSLGIDAYHLVRGYMKSFNEHYHLSEKESYSEGVIEAPEYESEDELFSDGS